ncbi:PAS domain-containing protein [bacterium]|nr:PAS domain-containing protein [bacterium]
MANQVSLTTQNRLIISGLMLSTVLIVAIAFFAIFNIQKRLNEGYHNFGQVVSKMMAIEYSEIANQKADTYDDLKDYADTIVSAHSDIVFAEFKDENGNTIYKSGDQGSQKIPNITVSSPLTINGENVGSVTVGMSGKIIHQISNTTRLSLMIVFAVAWIVFAFVILINTYLITRELRILHDGVHKISGGEFGYKIEEKDVSSEIKELFNSFNNMSHKLHIYEEQNIEQLTLERNKLEAILMSIANGVVVCDNNDNVVLLNNHAHNLLELEKNQMIDKKIQNYIDTAGNYCFKEKIEEFKDTPLEVMENKPLEFNIQVDKRTIKSVISPMFTRNKDYVGYIIVLIDMTKEAEIDAMRSTFISNVSHELRTPVTVLRSYIDTLYNYGNEFDYDTQKEFIGTINNEIIRLNRMVNDILDFSRMEANAQMEKSVNSIYEVVDNCVNQVQALTKERNLSIIVHKDENISEFSFNYDGIERALTNLLSNAIKYSPENGEINVNLKKIGKEVEITVTDKGCGIAPEHQKKIFDRFYRIENNIHTVKGTGLGLHLVKTTIEKYHNGKVFVISELGKGSTFGFTLPIEIYEENLV